MAHLVAACRRESEASGMLFRELTEIDTGEAPEPSIEALEKMAKAQAEWQAEARRFGMSLGAAPAEGQA